MPARLQARSTQPAPSGKPDWALSAAEAERARTGAPRSHRRVWPWLLVVLLIAAGAGLYAYRAGMLRTPVVTAPEASAERIMQVNTAEMTTLEPVTLQRTVRVIGTLAPIRQAQLSSQVSGRIEAVTVQPGDRVAAGDVLVQVDVETLALELRQVRSNTEATRAQLRLAEAQLERVRQLLERGVSAASTLDEAESTVAQLRASVSALQDQVAGAELRLRNATIRAPFAGIVAERAVEPGQYVPVGTPLVTVVDLTAVEMRGGVPVGAGAPLRPGQAVSVTVDGIDGRTFAGTVARINPVATEGTRTIPVYITMENAERMLLAGMFATGRIVVEEVGEALAVPTAALREDAEGRHLLQIVDGRLVRRPVEAAGEWAGGLTRIASGVEAGWMVVTAPLPALMPGGAVEIVED